VTFGLSFTLAIHIMGTKYNCRGDQSMPCPVQRRECEQEPDKHTYILTQLLEIFNHSKVRARVRVASVQELLTVR
jgi:hypothetical protein